jgi:hypothetical protein
MTRNDIKRAKIWRAIYHRHRIAQRKAQREAAHEMLLNQQLWPALSLPFDQALPVVKRFVQADFHLLFDVRMAKWCRDNSAAIKAASNPESK